MAAVCAPQPESADKQSGANPPFSKSTMCNFSSYAHTLSRESGLVGTPCSDRTDLLHLSPQGYGSRHRLGSMADMPFSLAHARGRPEDQLRLTDGRPLVAERRKPRCAHCCTIFHTKLLPKQSTPSFLYDYSYKIFLIFADRGHFVRFFIQLLPDRRQTTTFCTIFHTNSS